METARPKVISIRDDNFKANRENTHGNQSGSSESPSSTQWLAATSSCGQERLLTSPDLAQHNWDQSLSLLREDRLKCHKYSAHSMCLSLTLPTLTGSSCPFIPMSWVNWQHPSPSEKQVMWPNTRKISSLATFTTSSQPRLRHSDPEIIALGLARAEPGKTNCTKQSMNHKQSLSNQT